MRNAPSVSYPVGRSRFLAALLLALWLAGAVALLMGWHAQSLSGWRLGGLGCVLIVAGAGACRFWRNLSTWHLNWDGHGWRLLACNGPHHAAMQDGRSRQLSVHLDLQHGLLLRLRGFGQMADSVWIWAEAGTEPGRWHALRCAVYSRATTDAAADASVANP